MFFLYCWYIFKSNKGKNVDISELRIWLQENFANSKNLNSKRCSKSWFEKYGFLKEWDEIHTQTAFLDSFPKTKLTQRIWHIMNNSGFIKCANPLCENPPTFFSFFKGYLRTCSNPCAQRDPQTIVKIKETNLNRYGFEYGLSNKSIMEKSKQTVLEKYGVDNISKLSEISSKKKNTCMENYGTNWFLQRQNLKEKFVLDKYGVSNVQQVESITQKRIETRRSDFYDSLFTSNRLKGKCIPLFSKDEYVKTGIDKQHKFECTDCENSFLGWLHDGDIPRCPTCYPMFGSSLFEKQVLEYVQNLLGNSVNIIENERKLLVNNKEIDIWIPSHNLAIECDGLFWHGEYFGSKNKNYHLDKTKECESKNIRLIHIFEDEWRDKCEIVKSKIKHILHLNTTTRIYARNCKVEEIENSVKKNFLEQNHIQGNDASKICLGLMYNNCLISVMTFCNKRKFINYSTPNVDGEFELCRYASVKDFNIVGGASKLLSYFVKKYHPKIVFTYADRRWTQSEKNLYESIGFKKISSGTPNYWYFGKKENYKRFHRFGFAKHTLNNKLKNFDSNLTEWENMKNNGWDRIWDCGSLKYEIVF